MYQQLKTLLYDFPPGLNVKRGGGGGVVNIRNNVTDNFLNATILNHLGNTINGENLIVSADPKPWHLPGLLGQRHFTYF